MELLRVQELGGEWMHSVILNRVFSKRLTLGAYSWMFGAAGLAKRKKPVSKKSSKIPPSSKSYSIRGIKFILEGDFC